MRSHRLFGRKSNRRLLPALLVLLAGCSGWFTSEKAPPCPRITLVEGAEGVVRFAGEGRTRDDIAVEARIIDVAGQCEFTDDQRRVTVEMQLRIEGARGPALETDDAPLSYFVAIVAPDGQVLAR